MEHWKNLNLKNLNDEIWKQIIGYECLYEISNYGRVKILPKKAGTSFRKEKIKIIRISKKGYCTCSLWRNKISKNYNIHRLVAIAFINNPENKKTVNHKNAIKTDNHINNLEWATLHEQTTHAIRLGLLIPTTETKLKMSVSRIGGKRTEETKNKMSISALVAHKLRRESKAYYPKKGEGVSRKFTISIF